MNEEKDKMEITKEVLKDKDITTVSNSLKFKILGGLVALATTIFTLTSDSFKTWTMSQEKIAIREAELRMDVQRIIDSTKKVDAKRAYNQNLIDRGKIHDLMNDLRIDLPQSAQITLFYTHDSGGRPVTGSSLNMTALYTANNLEPCYPKSYWQNRPVPIGFFNYYTRLYFSKFLYVANLEQEADIFFDESKGIIECDERKSTMGIVLKETGYEVYYIVVNWNMVNPTESNPRALIVLRRYAAEIAPLIKEKQI